MIRYRVLPYRQGSKGARALADALGGRVLKLEGSTYKHRTGDKVINWGNTGLADHFFPHDDLLNHSDYIIGASNKLRFFRMMREAGHEDIIPPFWESPDDIPADRYPIVCRTVLAGHSGDGIIIANDPTELVPCSLYTRYLKKKDEYRVHVGRREINITLSTNDGPDYTTDIIAVQRKARRNDTPDEDVNWKVRSHANGFNYIRGGVAPDDDVISAARTALIASGLDFGAVDVIWNEENKRAYVLEINTAPGLEGQTVEDYANFFRT
jgi:hypothetical protein